MNTANILALATLIEHLPEEKFDMKYLISRKFNHCDTPSCIAGWAAWEEQGRPKEIENPSYNWFNSDGSIGHPIIASALSHLGITENILYVMDELFRGAYTYSSFSPAQAAATLRHFAATGEVDWEVPVA